MTRKKEIVRNTEQENYWNDRVESLEESFREWKKKRPLKKTVRQRLKKGPITVTNSFSTNYLKENGKFKKVCVYPELEGVMLEVIATPQAWKKIESFTLDHPDWFGLEFHSHFANPAVLEISEKNKPRGKQKKGYHYVNEIKIHAGILFAFFKYWCKQPTEKWPKYLRNVLDLCKRDEDYSLYVKTKKGGYEPKALTEYCIRKVHGESMQSLSLNPFNDPSNFYLTYIQDQRRPKRITEKFIKGKTPQEIANFAYSISALNFIFKALQVF